MPSGDIVIPVAAIMSMLGLLFALFKLYRHIVGWLEGKFSAFFEQAWVAHIETERSLCAQARSVIAIELAKELQRCRDTHELKVADFRREFEISGAASKTDITELKRSVEHLILVITGDRGVLPRMATVETQVITLQQAVQALTRAHQRS